MKLDRKLRMGMIGGGPGAFIGEVHRKASRLDGEIELVAGAFDIDPKKSRDMDKNLALDPKRVYNTYTDMIKAELALPAEQRIDFVAVTTPNNWHFPIARDFLRAGFHVMCEKPGLGNVHSRAVQCPVRAGRNKRISGKGTACEPYAQSCCTDVRVGEDDIAARSESATVGSSPRQRPLSKEVVLCGSEELQSNPVRLLAVDDRAYLKALAKAEASRRKYLRLGVPLWHSVQYVWGIYDSLPLCAFSGLLGKTRFHCGPDVARNIVKPATGHGSQAAISHQHRPYLIDDFW